MRPKKAARLLTMISAGLAIVVLIGFVKSGGAELTVSPVKGGEPLFVGLFAPGETFTLHYMHSVENAPIWEVHSLDGKGRIFIEEERYLKFGAGMGKMPGVGRMVMKGPYEAIVDMHQPVGDFILRVGSPGVDHTILWRGASLNLSKLAAHKAVLFEGKAINWWQKIYRAMFPHPATPQKPPGD